MLTQVIADQIRVVLGGERKLEAGGQTATNIRKLKLHATK